MIKAYEEIAEFIASGTNPESVAAFQPSDGVKARVGELLVKERQAGLAPDEASELEHYLQLEHLMRLAKARARQHMKR